MKKNSIINERELEIKKIRFYLMIGSLVSIFIVSWLILLVK